MSSETSLPGVGSWAGPWPSGPEWDRELLAEGDRRNVVDAYRYRSVDAIAADLARRAHPLHVAVENVVHDANIGTIVRTANAVGAAGVHVVGRARWNRRGAMVTDRYLAVHHHPDLDSLLELAATLELAVVAVDNTPGSVRLEQTVLPRRCLLLFGQEGPGLSEAARGAAPLCVSIAQFGSTRSINVGAAAG
ncbi:MAG: TrmH family RNA methyltransferase, partial [Mycobacteriaceae bacterium]